MYVCRDTTPHGMLGLQPCRPSFPEMWLLVVDWRTVVELRPAKFCRGTTPCDCKSIAQGSSALAVHEQTGENSDSLPL